MTPARRRQLRHRALQEVEQIGAHGASAIGVEGGWDEGYFDLSWAAPREAPVRLLADGTEGTFTLEGVLAQLRAELAEDAAEVDGALKPILDLLYEAEMRAAVLLGTARLQ